MYNDVDDTTNYSNDITGNNIVLYTNSINSRQ